MEVLFTATEDVSDEMNTPKFQALLAEFLKENFGKVVIRTSVEFDGLVTAEPGDPADLVGEPREKKR